MELFITMFIERGSVWHIASVSCKPMDIHTHHYRRNFCDKIEFCWKYYEKLLTTRWRQDHVGIFWIGCDLRDPSAVTHKGTTTLKCFSHFLVLWIFSSLAMSKLHVYSLPRANVKRKTTALQSLQVELHAEFAAHKYTCTETERDLYACACMGSIVGSVAVQYCQMQIDTMTLLASHSKWQVTFGNWAFN